MKNLLREAAFEIRELRKQNQLLRARTDVLDLFAHVAGARQSPSGMSPDVARALDYAVKELEAKETPTNGEAAPVQTPGQETVEQHNARVRVENARSVPIRHFKKGLKKAKQPKGGGGKVKAEQVATENVERSAALLSGSGKPSTVAGAMKREIAGLAGAFTSDELRTLCDGKYGGEDFWEKAGTSALSANLSWWTGKGYLEKTDGGYKMLKREFFSDVEF